MAVFGLVCLLPEDLHKLSSVVDGKTITPGARWTGFYLMQQVQIQRQVFRNDLG